MNDQAFTEKMTKERNGRNLSCQDLVSFEDLSNEDIKLIFDLAKITEELLKGEMKKTSLLKGKSQINFFMEESTRTRTSFELAGKNLGADTINISGNSSSLKKGETLLDTAITIDQMQPDIVIMRTGFSGAARFFAKNMKASIINAGDGWNEHPTQALLDLYTMLKFKTKGLDPSKLKGKRLTIVGDVLHSRVFGSLVRAATKYGLETIVSAPHTLIRPDMEKVWPIKHEPNIEKALKDADIVYALRLQTERAADADIPTLREYSKTYIINAKRIKLAKKDVIVMHPGPVIRELDVHTNILESDLSVIPDQVFSGYCVRFALLWLLGQKRKEKNVESRLYKPY